VWQDLSPLRKCFGIEHGVSWLGIVV
jgi:hypothetical protein